MTIEASGVNYIQLDAAKRLGQEIAATTGICLPPGFIDVEWSRGESVQLVDCGDFYIGGLIETLGTQNLVTDAVDAENFGNQDSYYRQTAQNNAATVLNDMATGGVQPLQFFLKIDVCEEEWLTNRRRIEAIFRGTADACRLASCAYQGGEIPSLKDLVVPGVAILSGSATGIVRPKENVIRPRLKPGDRIILLFGTGPHANGYTRIREIGSHLKGYGAKLADGSTFGVAALAPMPIYSPAIQRCFVHGIWPHYAVNITGHGWRKLMRAAEPFGYVIESVPTPQPIFRFIQEQTAFTDKKMYGSYNMGAGFALFVAPEDAAATLAIVREYEPAIDAGFVDKSTRGRYVYIKPLDVEFDETDLQLR